MWDNLHFLQTESGVIHIWSPLPPHEIRSSTSGLRGWGFCAAPYLLLGLHPFGHQMLHLESAGTTLDFTFHIGFSAWSFSISCFFFLISSNHNCLLLSPISRHWVWLVQPPMVGFGTCIPLLLDVLDCLRLWLQGLWCKIAGVESHSQVARFPISSITVALAGGRKRQYLMTW